MKIFFILTFLLYELKSEHVNRPTFHNLNGNPGLFPFQLGRAQNQIDFWTFLQVFDITKITREFFTVQKTYDNLKTPFRKSVHSKNYEIAYYNLCRLGDVLQSETHLKITQINPFYTKRTKRGLIDGLGIAIKFITGNLDSADAEKYDKAITELTSTQSKFRTLLKDQITLLQFSSNKFENTSRTLLHNQETLNKKLDYLENVIKNTAPSHMDTYSYFLLVSVMNEIIGSFQVIYDTLEKLEVAITFSKLNTFHNSIADPANLLKEISQIKKHIKGNQLPFEPILENILLFEKIINIKAFSVGNRINFVLEIPVVSSKSYSYYKFYPVPIQRNNQHKIIIPHSKFIIINQKEYGLFNKECKEVTNGKFICDDVQSLQINKDSPCEVQLISYFTNITKCHAIPVKFEGNFIKRLNQNSWIISTNKEIVAKQKCSNLQENIPLNGAFLLEMGHKCEITIDKIGLSNVKAQNLANLKITALPRENNLIEDSKIEHIPLKIDPINLDEFKEINFMIKNQKENLADDIIYSHKTSIYTIFLYLFLVVSIICFIYYKFKSIPKIKQDNIELRQNSVVNPIVL